MEKQRTLRVSQVTVPLRHTKEQVFAKACRICGVRKDDVLRFAIVKQSVDARHKDDLKYSYTVELELDRNIRVKKDRRIVEYTPVVYAPAVSGVEPLQNRTIGSENETGTSILEGADLSWNPIAVIGAGPAGLFCAWLLAKNGYCPVVLERGKCVDERQADVEAFWQGGCLNPESNVQFGEGGAGTFSDGKLNTQVKDKFGRNHYVLETFVTMGAPEDILYVNKPHIGTDILQKVVANMRREIIRMGGKFFFSAKVTDFIVKDGRLSELEINHGERLAVSAAVFAIGHSARDTFLVLKERSVPMTAKAFAVGLRVEHPQRMIDESQYGENADFSLLPTASYKLTHQAANGRSVYSFCMCPGGYVVNASSEEGRLAVNGMSDRARDSKNANSAVVVAVIPEDFPHPDNPLGGLEFQRELEQKTWALGQGRIPQQRFGKFESALSECLTNISCEKRHFLEEKSEISLESGEKNGICTDGDSDTRVLWHHLKMSSGKEDENVVKCGTEISQDTLKDERKNGLADEMFEPDDNDCQNLLKGVTGKENEKSASFESCTKGQTMDADLTSLFSDELNDAFVEAMHAFGHKIKGFDRPDAILSGVESRTSSPVRIPRDESFQSEIRGLYPCGEGAGYAGGITSAAMDGLKVAEALMARFAPLKSQNRDNV